VTALDAVIGSGGERDLTELLAPLVPGAQRLAYAMLQNRHEAEDAVQEATFKAWRAYPRFREGSDLRSWFLTIVANECRTARRARSWRVLRFAELRAEPRPDRLEERVDLDAALDRLPQPQLLALSLYYHLDLPIEEVARVLGCNVGAARQRIHRALAVLRPGMALEADA
jgi:RNA polymerase sigma-70 factor (ECF subfamily)